MTHFSRILASLLFALASLSAAEDKPNILFLLSDDQAWGDYGFMGHPEIETPALDRIEADSLSFERGYTPVPLCRPSLASIVSGIHPHEHGVTGNDPKTEGGRNSPEYLALNETITNTWQQNPNWIRSLKESGYRSLQTGKWWEGNPVTNGDFTEGMTIGDRSKGGRHGDVGLSIGRKGLQPIKDFIAKPSEEPWFIWYGVFLPHTPHNPPQELLDKYLKKTDNKNLAAYWANCEWLDQTIGELMAYLEESGELDNTLIIYTCDNGWIQDENKRDRFAKRSKRTVYEGGIRTPILFSWKDHIEPRRDTKHLATNLDIWPTAAKLCGTPLPEGLTGIDLTDSAALEARDTIYGSEYEHDLQKVGTPSESLNARYIIEGDWKLIIPFGKRRDNPTTQLFNLAQDPGEKENLADKFPDKVTALRAKADQWWTPSK